MPESLPDTPALAVYGSLQPGAPNAHVLAPLKGIWSEGYVLGHLEDSGWGAAVGFAGIRLSEDGQRIPVRLFTSDRLPEFWDDLDGFEGGEYRRRVCTVETSDGPVGAYIYELATSEK